MTQILAVCSMLHETAEANSATRSYLGMPVLAHTVARLAACERLGGVGVLCWQDQLAAAEAACEGSGASLLPHGQRQVVPQLAAVTAAGHWLDGWRGGLLQTTPHDRGFFASTIDAVATATEADAVLLIDPAAALLDPQLVDRLLTHAHEKPGHDLYFTPAAPGLTGLLVGRQLLKRFAGEHSHPGRLLHYLPDMPRLDPVAADWCCHGPACVARTLTDFRLDSDRDLRWAERVLSPEVNAEQLVRLAESADDADPPRDLMIELTTRRATRPNWLHRVPEMDLDLPRLPELIRSLLAESDDLRLTIAGRGDPLHRPAELLSVIEQARALGIPAIHVETDLLQAAESVVRLATVADVISVHLPATTAATYRVVMGVDGFDVALRNLATLIAVRDKLSRGTPLIVPTFIKTAANLHEMEDWYDQWLRTVGSAVIRGPDALGNRPPENVTVAQMIRSERRSRELRVLADGMLTDDLNDPLGRLGEENPLTAWSRRSTNQPRKEAA